jgi:hypothetical protein
MHIFRISAAAALLAVTVLLTGCGQKVKTVTWTGDKFSVTYPETWTDITPEDTGGVAGVSLSKSDSASTSTIGVFDASASGEDAKTSAEQLLASKDEQGEYYGITYTEKQVAEGEVFGCPAWYAEWLSAHEDESPSRSRVYYIEKDGTMIGVTLYAEDAAEFDALTSALPEMKLEVAPKK